MKLCWFEDDGVALLEPLTLSRAAFSLWCGANPLWRRQHGVAPGAERGAWIRPHLADLTRAAFADWAVNDPAWLDSSPAAFINSRWLPPVDFRVDLATPSVGVVDGQIAYVVRPAVPLTDHFSVESWTAECLQRCRTHQAPGAMIDFLWNIVDANATALAEDAESFMQCRSLLRMPPAGVSLLGQRERLFVEESAQIEPFVVADTRRGPVYIDRGATIGSFSLLEGPCYIGPETIVLGAKIRSGTTLGPCCRIGGEVEAALIQGYSNKSHDGFLGHSYLGEWVNLAAATQTGNLRNDYAPVNVTVNGRKHSTQKTKVGSFIGDHTKTGLGTLLNAGTVIGVFANVLPAGMLLPRVIPSFSQVNRGQLDERYNLSELFTTAQKMMSRRGVEMMRSHRDLFNTLFTTTAESRLRAMRYRETRQIAAVSDRIGTMSPPSTDPSNRRSFIWESRHESA